MTRINKPLVFLVEDNNAYCILISRVLQKNGFMVMAFEHGKKAAEMLNHIQPDLILSDIEMPYMDGFELHDYVSKTFVDLNIPFIYLSSTTSKEMIKKAGKIGATHMLDKPVSGETLKETIFSVLSLSV